MQERRLDKTVPQALRVVLGRMGEDLSAARRVRKLTQADLAQRLNVDRRLVIRMEKGDPTVGFGAYAAAAWIMGLEENIAEMFAPAKDPVFQRESRLDLARRVRKEGPAPDDLDF